MNLRKFMPCILGAVMGLGVYAQTPVRAPRKCDILAQKRLAEKVQLISVIIKCSNSQALAEDIKAAGYYATAINGTMVTARVSSTYLVTLDADKRVSFIQAARKMSGKTVDARAATGVDKIQSGEGLETPYTGKGVIVGVIDQGFEFRHIGFLDKNSQPRVISVWNRKGYSDGKDSNPTTDIPANGDGINIEGHATHVTNIAAGSKIAENDYYGMAPEADIIMIPSEFDESEIVEDIKYINDFASKKGEPWVINMSFGNQIGAHDGTSYFGLAVDSMITKGKGHQICVAASNEGETKIHASHTFTSDKDTVSLLIKPGYYGSMMNIWCQNTDSLNHLKMRPFIYSDGIKEYHDSAYWADYRGDQIAPFNRKQNTELFMNTSDILGVDIIGDAGSTFHAWTNSYYGEFMDSPGKGYISGDYLYSLNELAADISHCVTVGAYVTSDTYTNTSGLTLDGGFGTVGSLCSFSCKGPALSSVPKPTVTAPGSVIKSAVSKYGVGFEKSGSYIVQDVKRGIKHFYYGAMSGTSMATPVVTGIVALWLQANPNLTAEQISDIMRTTAKHDSFTGNDEWNSSWGYGKIDAYEGLKAALKLIDPTDVKEYTLSSPVTLSKDNDEWRILFNTAETSADISVSDIAGVTVLSHHIANAACGQEEKVSFSSMKHGVYIIRISTPHGTIVRKVII